MFALPMHHRYVIHRGHRSASSFETAVNGSFLRLRDFGGHAVQALFTFGTVEDLFEAGAIRASRASDSSNALDVFFRAGRWIRNGCEIF